MPFKTRRQKLAAAQRRYTLTENILVSYKTGQSEGNFKKAQDYKKETPEKTKLIEDDYSYVRLDLLKTVLFAGAIITIQLLLLLKI